MEDPYSQRTSYFLDRKSIKASSPIPDSLYNEIRSLDDKSTPFVRLLGGNESPDATRTRWKLYNKAWTAQKSKIDDLLNSANDQLLEDISSFVRDTWNCDDEAAVDTALILPGSNIANHLRMFSQIRDRMSQLDNTYMASISSKESPNLKTALKMLVGRLTKEESEIGEEELGFDRRLRYDLDIITDWCQRQAKLSKTSVDNMRIVIMVEDADSFEISILTGLIRMLQSYISSIPFKLMLSVATSPEVFQDKLPRSCIAMINGRPFHAQMTDGIEKILEATMFTVDANTLLVGPKLFNQLIHRQLESMQSVEAFISSLKFMFMTHYFANPFCLFSRCGFEDDPLAYDSVKNLITPDHLRAIRMMNSFKNVTAQAAEKSPDMAKRLLEDDDYLVSVFPAAIKEFRRYYDYVLTCIDLIIMIQRALNRPTSKKSELYPQALTGTLLKSEAVENLILDATGSTDASVAVSIYQQLKGLSSKSEGLKGLYNSFNHEFGEMLTWVSKQDLNAPNKQPFNGMNQIMEFLFVNMQKSTTPYSDFLLYEAFLVDASALLETVFVPTHRPAIELALSDPRHYWGISSNENYFDPPISILYHLYRESSLFINSFDYYTAFKYMLPTPEDDMEWDKRALAWFLQGIVELKMLGILRDSKRKFECVEKLAWRDL
uniref:ARAD1C03652p n=1 Tax=Blastobotrys adeninivorans TaxID=409370 RepID=A0A060SYU4_BLAAD